MKNLCGFVQDEYRKKLHGAMKCACIDKEGDNMAEYNIRVKGVVRNQGQYLILQHWYDDNITEPYQWEFVDADLKFGESPDSTVLNAIEEKTGIVTQISRILYTWSYVIGEKHYLGITYLCDADTDIVILSEELNGYEWVDKEELDIYIQNKSVLQDVMEAIEKL